jgi:hypothetical protein
MQNVSLRAYRADTQGLIFGGLVREQQISNKNAKIAIFERPLWLLSTATKIAILAL